MPPLTMERLMKIAAMAPPGPRLAMYLYSGSGDTLSVFMLQGRNGLRALEDNLKSELLVQFDHFFPKTPLPPMFMNYMGRRIDIQNRVQLYIRNVCDSVLPADGTAAGTHFTVRRLSLPEIEAMLLKDGNDGGNGIADTTREALFAALLAMRAGSF